MDHAAYRPLPLFKGSRGEATQRPCAPPVIMSSPSNPQFRMTITALVLSTLSLARIPEISDYLIGRWKRCRPLEAALEWVPMILDQLIPNLRDSLGDPIEPEIDSLENVTKRYVPLSRTEPLDANIVRRCLLSLRFLEIRDRRNKTFIPWTYDGRKELVNEVETDIVSVNGACSVSANALAQQNRGISWAAGL